MVHNARSGLLGELLRRSLGTGGVSTPKLVSVLDPGTEYVKALVVQIEGDSAVVIGEGIDRHGELPFERGSRAVDLRLQRACDAALRQAEDMTEVVVGTKRVPDHLAMTIPSHLIRQGAFTVKQKRNFVGEAISEKELEHALSRAERLVVQQLAGLLGVSRSEVVLIGAEVMDIKVNGHSVSDPLGFYGDTLAVTLFNALVRDQYVAMVDRLAEHLELEVVALVSSEYALADCLPMEEAIVIDMGSALTSVSWVKSGCPMRTTTIPWGGRNLSQRLAAKFELTQDKAEALKLRYSLGYLEDESNELVTRVLWHGLVEWLARVEAALATIAAKSSLPPYIYLCGGGSELEDVVKAARHFPWLRHLSFIRYPEIQPTGPGHIPSVFNRTLQSWGREMTTGAALARWALPRKRAEDPLRNMLERVIRRNLRVYSGGWSV